MHLFAGVLLVDQRGWVLLQERDEHPALDPEKWGLPGGHLDEGEGFEEAAYRELAEETGVHLQPGTLRQFGEFEVWHEAYDSLDTMAAFYADVVLGDADIDCREGRRIVFVQPDRARRLDLTASARLVLPAFLDSTEYAALGPRSDGVGSPRGR